ncbi:MAG: hypothetical protein U0894_20775 [Pirellulales bacterium]
MNLPVLLVGTILLVLDFFLGVSFGTRESRRAVLFVNGEAVHRSDLDETLVLFRDEALRILATQRIIDQEAKRLGVVVSDGDLDSAGLSPDDSLRRVQRANQRTELLFRKLVLHDFSEAEKQQLYGCFKDELMLYKVSLAFLRPSLDIVRLRNDLVSGENFRNLKTKYGSNPPGGFDEASFLRPVRMEALRTLIGPANLSAVKTAKVGEVVGPLPSLGGPILLQIESVQEDYADLKPAIEDIIYQSQRVRYQRLLGVDSAVSSPLALTPAKKPVSASPALENPGLASPHLSGSPTVPLIPLPSESSSPLEPGIPKPLATPTSGIINPLPALPAPKDTPGFTPPELTPPRGSSTP